MRRAMTFTIACLAWSWTAGCAAGSYSMEAPVAAQAVSKRQPAPQGPVDGSIASAPQGGEGNSTPVARAADQSRQAHIARKIVYTGWFTLDVYDLRAAQQRLVELAEEMGGYMQETRGPVVVVRVPAGRFDEIEPALRELGRLDDSQTTIRAQDVTEEYVDVELRLKTKREYLETLTKMLASAGELKDKLAVQQEIARVVEEIESLEGRLRVLAQRVSLATVTVTFRLATTGPKRTFRLPWGWLDRLGIENLVR